MCIRDSYAYYLKETRLNHPMAEEIIDYYPNTYNQVVNSLNEKIPESKKIWYQKHMAHHLIHFKNIDWIENFHNCFLIRHPKDVITSYVRKNQLNHIDELGYPQQWKLIEYLKDNKKNIIVIDSSILLENPKKILNEWCKNLNIEFYETMLSWEKGHYSTDGIWWKHWYNNVTNTTQFELLDKKSNTIPNRYQDIYNEALDYYKKLSYFVVK